MICVSDPVYMYNQYFMCTMNICLDHRLNMNHFHCLTPSLSSGVDHTELTKCTFWYNFLVYPLAFCVFGDKVVNSSLRQPMCILEVDGRDIFSFHE